MATEQEPELKGSKKIPCAQAGVFGLQYFYRAVPGAFKHQFLPMEPKLELQILEPELKVKILVKFFSSFSTRAGASSSGTQFGASSKSEPIESDVRRSVLITGVERGLFDLVSFLPQITAGKWRVSSISTESILRRNAARGAAPAALEELYQKCGQDSVSGALDDLGVPC